MYNKLFEEVIKEANPPESIIDMFMNTSFNGKLMSKEKAIENTKNLGPKLREQIYGKNSRLYFHASDRPHDVIKESIQRSGESLCFFANKPEAALAVAKARHNWNYDFCFLHICTLKSQVDLFNPQCESDFKKVSFSQKELESIQDICSWLESFGSLRASRRWWRVYETKPLPTAIKKAGFSGIALYFWDIENETPEENKTEGIALGSSDYMVEGKRSNLPK